MAKDVIIELKIEKEKAEADKKIYNLHQSATVIQKHIKGYLARKRYREKKILLKLNPSVQQLADEYIVNGKFWDFMDAVNEKFNQYEHNAKLEEEAAVTFIQGTYTVYM